MIKKLLPLCILVLIHSLSPSSNAWEEPYTGEDATGADIIALWKFLPDSPATDNSENGHLLTVRGQDSYFVEDGKFQGALRITDEMQPGDNRQGATTQNSAALNPEGAFSIEMWIQPDENTFKDKSSAYLIDKKYLPKIHKDDSHTGYMLLLRKAKGQGNYWLEADLGFGETTEVVRSAPNAMEPGVWYHIAFTYDGNGLVTFYVDGYEVGSKQLDVQGPIAASRQALVIGDRIGSMGARFTGLISEVRLTRTPLKIEQAERVLLENKSSRTAFQRMEPDAQIQLTITNQKKSPLQNTSVEIKGLPSGTDSSESASSAQKKIPDLAPGESFELILPIDTSLKPDAYTCEAQLISADSSKAIASTELTLTIVPRSLPHQMPVISWAWLGQSAFPVLKEIGFTHFLSLWQSSTAPTIKYVSEESMPVNQSTLDQAFANQLYVLASISPKHPTFRKKFGRIDFEGNETSRLNGLFPEVQETFYEAGKFIADHFAAFPGFQGAMVATEQRDHTIPSFHELDQAAYQKFAGTTIPAEIAGSARHAAPHIRKQLPPTRILDDNNPILRYYQWFWKEGDGWNNLYNQIDKGLKSTDREDIWTFHDPATRTPSIWGSGGEVDFLSNWTYTYPDPLRMSLSGEELRAMAAGRADQDIMQMIQIIWYRTGTAPEKSKTDSPAQWELDIPDAKFITIAPDHLSEAFWLMLANPVKGIMFHGWGSLVGDKHNSYKLTNPETKETLKSLIHQLVIPLGPTLLQVPNASRDVAVLQSFTSEIFGNRGTFGWGRSWAADAFFITRYAGLQPDILFEDSLEETSLDAYKVIVLPHCDYLTQSTFKRLQEFQSKGGLIVADEFLPPVIQPDILLPSFRRTHPENLNKEKMLELAKVLQNELAPFYQPYAESKNPEVILQQRQFENSSYLFAINDHRTFGNYVGQHQKVQEKGLPASSTIAIQRPNAHIYSLLTQKEIPTTQQNEQTTFNIELPGAQGDLFLILEHPVGALEINAPTKAESKSSIHAKIQLLDAQKNPLPAVVPLHVNILDPNGNPAEFSGYYGAPNGFLEMNFQLASNDLPGDWTIHVTEGISGQKSEHTVTVQ